MQSALRLGESGPTTCARVFSRPHRSRAMRAPNAGLVLIMKLVVRHIVIVDVGPHLLGCPIDNGIDLPQAEFRIPFNSSRGRSDRCLVAANARNRCVELAYLAA